MLFLASLIQYEPNMKMGSLQLCCLAVEMVKMAYIYVNESKRGSIMQVLEM